MTSTKALKSVPSHTVAFGIIRMTSILVGRADPRTDIFPDQRVTVTGRSVMQALGNGIRIVGA